MNDLHADLEAERAKVELLRTAIRNYLHWPFRSSEEALKQALDDTDTKEQ